MRAKQLTERGFSLLECLIVLALVIILGVLATPLMTRNSPVHNLNAAARMVQGNIQQARLMAQRDNRPCYVDFSQDLNGDGVGDVVVWRDLGNAPLNQTLDMADNDGDGVPDEMIGSDCLVFNVPDPPAYGRQFDGIAVGTGNAGPAMGPPNFAGLWNVNFWDPITLVAPGGGQLFVANPDGTCSTGSVFLAEVPDPVDPQPTRAAYCVVVSPAGSAQVWRWTSTRAVWERL